jgi:anti-sigma-K factor RskA
VQCFPNITASAPCRNPPSLVGGCIDLRSFELDELEVPAAGGGGRETNVNNTYRVQVDAAERRALRKAKQRNTPKQSEKSWKRSPLLWRSDNVVTAAAHTAATPGHRERERRHAEALLFAAIEKARKVAAEEKQKLTLTPVAAALTLVGSLPIVTIETAEEAGFSAYMF